MSVSQLAAGANWALIGNEMIQFARAESLGASRWRLSGLLRGRAGTEWAIGAHGTSERFVLLDDAPVALDPVVVGDSAYARIAAVGLADTSPVIVPIGLPGASLRPLSPVHGAVDRQGDGSLILRWTRRARGAWLWLDAVEVPLVEQAESYLVSLGPSAAPVAQWIVTEPRLVIDATAAAAFRGQALGATFAVVQRGDSAVSPALALGPLT